ncbi:MAG: single-stranded DNA-binding protein [Alphaproteobacteria bacterium]
MINRVFILGNLGADPELKTTGGGSSVCEMRIATSESWFDKSSNERKERTNWHRVIVWGKSAENCAKYLRKGSKAFVEGRIQTREWQDQSGNKRHTTEIVANSVQFIDTKSGGGGQREPAKKGGRFEDSEIPF